MPDSVRDMGSRLPPNDGLEYVPDSAGLGQKHLNVLLHGKASAAAGDEQPDVGGSDGLQRSRSAAFPPILGGKGYPDEIAFYDALAERPEVLQTMGDETLKILATALTQKLRSSTTVDWQVREAMRAKMRILIRQLLRKYKYPPEVYEDAITMVLKQAEAAAGDRSASQEKNGGPSAANDR